MWKTIFAACLVLGAVYFGAGCAETPAVVPFIARPATPPRPLLPPPNPNESIAMNTVVIGNVGKPIGRDSYAVLVTFDDPGQLLCKVTFRPLAAEAPVPLAQVVAPNIQLTGPGTDNAACTETLYLLRKDLSCTVKKRGLLTLTFQSANRALAVGFGFICWQNLQKVDSSVSPVRTPVILTHHQSGGSKRPAVPTVGSAEEEPSPPKLTKHIDEATNGHDDQHKILTLAPCDEPLKGAGGSIKIGKLSSRRYVVHKPKTCEVEVGDVRASELEADTKVVLTP